MSLVRSSFLAAAAMFAMVAPACGHAPETTGSGGTGGATSASSTSVTNSSSSSTSGPGSGGSGPMVEPSGLSCSGQTPAIAAVAQITNKSCTTGVGCHTAMASAPGMYDMLVNRIAEECLDNRLMIKPGDPEHSYVIHKITNHNVCTGQTMPKDGALLPAADIQTIYDWICSGAPNH